MLTEGVEGEKWGFGQVVIIKWLSIVIYLAKRHANKVTKMTEVWSCTEFCVIVPACSEFEITKSLSIIVKLWISKLCY